MKALVKESAGTSYEYKDVPVPVPRGDELLVRVGKVALCGSDIALYQWNNVAQAIAKVPFTPGHEMVGEIVGVGDDVGEQFSVGGRVCVENHFFCGHCYQCTHDQRHICQNLNQFGHGKGTVYGGCSEYTIIPSRYAYLLTTDLDDARAAILEPCGVAHQALEEINPKGEDILIQGCGPVGLLAIGLAKVMGATKIIAADIVESRLESAQKLGAHVTVNCSAHSLRDAVMRETSGNGVGRLVEATGASVMVNNCFSLLRKGGHVALIGLPKEPIHIDRPLEDVIFKSLTLKTVHGRKIFHTWQEIERIMHRNLLKTEPLITHDFPMSQYQEAFRVLMSGEGCKVLITPGS
jgi:2-desacetyl-2-hydroxyethyl bacteriochlorophyllide A dehydrogenase